MRILLIEDNPGDARLLREMLGEQASHDTDVTHVARLSEAEAHIADHAFDIILLDLGLPDAQGLEAVTRVRSAASHVPLVVLTGMDDESLAIQTLQQGAQDYLVKGQIEPRGLLRALRYAIERKILKEALFAEKERAQVTLNAIGDAVVCIDNAGKITFLNLVGEKMTGWVEREAVGRPMAEVVQILDATSRASLSKTMGQETQWDGTAHPPSNRILVRRDGLEIPVENSVAPIRDRDRQIIGAMVVLRNVGDLRESEARNSELAGLNVTLETRIEEWTRERDRAWRNSQDLQVVLDTQGVLRVTNEAWMTTLGWHPDEVIGHNHLEFVHPEDREASDDRLAAVMVGAWQPVFEQRLRHKDDTYRWVSWVFARDDNLIYASGRDITSEKEADAELATTQDQLRQSQKMELLGQLTGGIAHDFNNLLGIVQLNLELIQERLGQDPEAEDMAQMAIRATHRGASLTHQLLAYARQQPLEPKTVNIETLLSGMTSLLGRTLGANIDIQTKTSADLWMTRIDPHQLENALLNLAVNALHAMPDGGKLIIEASNKELDSIFVAQNPDVVPGSFVMVSVTDTGTGMSAAILERVLEPFFTTKPVGTGSGLGLSMVHGFAKQSGGHLKIHSEVGHGTTVTLYLPKASQDAELPVPLDHREAPPSTDGERVLVVEDDSLLRGLTLKILAGLGYQTLEAEDGPAACLISDQVDHIDLLLTDIVLPKGMYGPEIAQRIRARRPDIKVLYMSGYPRDAVFHNGALGSHTNLLSKPFSKAELAELVRRALDKRDET